MIHAAVAPMVLILSACGSDSDAAQQSDWEVQTPEEHDMDPQRLDDAREYAFEEGRHTQGVVVVRHGVIVAEWYEDGADESSWATSFSMAKSFTSALVGIAIDEGLIPSVDEPMTTYFPEWEGTPREEITIGHVLRMSSGLDFTEGGISDCFSQAMDGDRDLEDCRDEGDDLDQMLYFSTDQLAYAADRPPLDPPGSDFAYSSGDTMLLSGVIAQATGMSAAEYAQEKLFDPIGMGQVEWWEDDAGNTLTYAFLDSTSRDFARFGLLYLNGGSWGDQQVVPEQWVADSVSPSLAWDWYGYQWWLELGTFDRRMPADTFNADGLGGQVIYVIPSLDLVVVRNSTFIKYDGDAVASNLFDAFIPYRAALEGSVEMGWDDSRFLLPIVDSIEGFEIDESSCPYEWGGSCRGDLDAGTYTTNAFEPAFTFTVPAGWNNGNDHANFFTIGTELEIAGDFVVFRNMVAALSAPDHDWPPQADDAVGNSVDDLVAWLTAHPELETTDPEPVTVGGLDGFQLDIGFAEGVTSTTAWCDVDACMHLFVEANSTDDPVGWSLYGSGDVFRAFLLTTPDGDTVMVFLDEYENTPETFQAYLELTQPIVDSIEFSE